MSQNKQKRKNHSVPQPRIHRFSAVNIARDRYERIVAHISDSRRELDDPENSENSVASRNEFTRFGRRPRLDVQNEIVGAQNVLFECTFGKNEQKTHCTCRQVGRVVRLVSTVYERSVKTPFDEKRKTKKCWTTRTAREPDETRRKRINQNYTRTYK